ncbi:hypothetical protein F5Y06DRAFT_194063 [Hypoxylon sp. FL0890]|nr:hypothetical protein F5Y06DRAFT_194063 [Hypoxylon sp. FL0890]
MEVPPADPRRVAARAVGRTPEEHAALERALARRRARRAARSQQQGGTPKRRQESPAPAAGQSINETRITTTAKPQLTPEERQLNAFKRLFAIPWFKDAVLVAERERLASIRRAENRRRGIWDPEPIPRLLQGWIRRLPVPPRSYYENLADEYEAHEQDPGLVETRARIRAETGLSEIWRIVLLLVTQIPWGRWTTYPAIHEHLRETGCQCPAYQICQALCKNPLGDAVPYHRVLASAGGFGRPMNVGYHCEDEEEMCELLLQEGMELRADGSPKGVVFREFVGCPRV